MKKNPNKQLLKNNYDYLNFIRRNQQIVKQFKQLSQIDKKAQQYKKNLMQSVSNGNYNTQRPSVEGERYTELPPFFQDSIFGYKQKVKQEMLGNDAHLVVHDQNAIILKNDPNFPIKIRKQTDLTQKTSQPEIFSRNLSIPSKFDKILKDQAQINQVYSQLKFPKLPTRHSKLQKQLEQRSNSQASLAHQNQIKQNKSNNFRQREQGRNNNNKQRSLKLNKDNWKKNYAPLSVQNSKAQHQNNQSPIHCSINSLKFSQINKNRINHKLIKTYYDYQNLRQLKQRIDELMPTFKPIQTKKKQRVHILQLQKQHQFNQLEQYLQANMIKKYNKKYANHQKKKSQSQALNFNLHESADLQIRSQSIIANRYYETVNPQNTPRESQQIIQEQLQEQLESQEKLQKQLTLLKSHKNNSSPTRLKRNKKQIKILQKNSMNTQEQTVYHNKIQSYREFLFLVNFCHRVFDPLIIRDDPQKFKNQNKYKYYIGPGNNGLLVKSLMKRRFWWVQVDDPKNANFVWTQLKINNYYQFQLKTKLTQLYDKLDEHHEYTLPKQKKIQRSKTIADLNKKGQQPKVGGILRGILPEGEKKIFTNADNLHLSKMLEKATQQNPTMKNFHKFQNRLKYLPEQFLKKRQESYSQIHVHNHFMYNYQIGNKKALFYNLKHYYEMIGVNPFNSIPLTFHIKKGVQDPQYAKFMKQYKKIKADLEKAQKDNSSKKKLSRNVWIVKPGQLSNRGNGITVIDQIYQLNTILKSKDKHKDGVQKTYIVQKYIEKPMLYKNRKFDIRHYMMISRLHGRLRAYWFSQGYIRTSSYQYDLQQVGDVMIHLTNDAIQKYGASYGKYEEGNKLSYAEFQRYLDGTYPEKKYSFIDSIYPRMREIATDAVKSTYFWMDPDKLEHNFQVFGLDFMIDANFNVWLIEVNTNPCLELSSGLLGRIIPTMVQNALRLCVDPIFPPTAHYLNTIKYLAPDSAMQRLQFQLIFDESRDGKKIQQLIKKHGKANCGQIQQEDQTYQNDGKQIDLGGDLQ